MQRNFSLPQISLQYSSKKDVNSSNSTTPSPYLSHKKSYSVIKSQTQLDSTNDESKQYNSYYSPQKQVKFSASSERHLPKIQQKSIQEMQQQISQQDQKLQQQLQKAEEITTILLEDNNLIIQPKFFEKKGSMCTTELWSGSQKKEFLVFSQQEITSNSSGKKKLKVKRISSQNRKGNMTEVEKLLANIYRPEKLQKQAEVNRILEDLKQGVQITKQSIEEQIKHYENRTPLDIKVRMLQKKKTMVFDGDENNTEDEFQNLKQIPDLEETKSSSLKNINLSTQFSQSEKGYQFEIQEVEDERLESSPMNAQNYEQIINYSSRYDSVKQSDEDIGEDYVLQDNETPNKNDMKTNQINLVNTSSNKDLRQEIQVQHQNTCKHRNISMPKPVNKQDSINKSRNLKGIFEAEQSKKNQLKQLNLSKQVSSESDIEIKSLNNIPNVNIQNSDTDDDNEALTDRNNENELATSQDQINYEQILKNTKNPELKGYVNSIRNVIEECNQSLEQNTILTKQIKKHTYKLNNRHKNFKSVSNLEKRIESSTIF